MRKHFSKTGMLNIIVIVAALGYFVDIYDLILFSITRIDSLKAIGINDVEELKTKGEYLISLQMIGMLVGGIIWGIMGDKRGRVSVLFGSIIMYSLANLANAWFIDISNYLGTDPLETYAWLRFIAGIGLAGELGAGITLVNETMSKEDRGYGTMIVVSFGVLGAVAANRISLLGWQNAYIIGGLMGFALLLLRIGVYESHMFHSLSEKNISKGNFMKLFNNRKRFISFISCIAVGIPIWFMIGILTTFADVYCKINNIIDIKPKDAVMYFYIGTSFGDFMSGFLSQVFRSRKKVLLGYLIFSAILIPTYLFSSNISATTFYIISALLGVAAGYWAVFVTIASEQFGTDIRSIVTTTVPNFVRGSLVGMTLLNIYFRETISDVRIAALLVGIIALVIAFISLLGMHETHGKDLNYVEK
ncbi:MAG: MFS transporter [Bacteroidetes bacterium]|nr:MFS transporter [Bacteroidota bacterium]